MELTNSEKLDLINTMDFIDFDADCEGIVYVLVEDNDKNRDILHKIGLTNEDIEKDCFVEDGTMDISMVAFRYSNYYNAKEKTFYNEDEDSICYGCQYYIGGEEGCNPPNICIEGSLNNFTKQ